MISNIERFSSLPSAESHALKQIMWAAEIKGATLRL